jgi:hypothetical protein
MNILVPAPQNPRYPPNPPIENRPAPLFDLHPPGMPEYHLAVIMLGIHYGARSSDEGCKDAAFRERQPVSAVLARAIALLKAGHPPLRRAYSGERHS